MLVYSNVYLVKYSKRFREILTKECANHENGVNFRLVCYFFHVRGGN